MSGLGDVLADRDDIQHRILFKGLAVILEEGAEHLRGYSLNSDARIQAETLEVMAKMARKVAALADE